MKNLELKQQLAFCEKHGIAPNELLLFQVILLMQEGDYPEIVSDYFQLRTCSRGSTREMLVKLQDCGIINKSFKIPETGSIDPHIIPLNKNIVKDYYKCSFELGKELFDAYPQFTTINGNVTSIRSISKKYDSLEDFYRAYGKIIHWSPEKHAEIIELVEWGKENNVINCTLANFIIDQKWLALEAMRNGDLGTVNLDAVKLV